VTGRPTERAIGYHESSYGGEFPTYYNTPMFSHDWRMSDMKPPTDNIVNPPPHGQQKKRRMLLSEAERFPSVEPQKPLERPKNIMGYGSIWGLILCVIIVAVVTGTMMLIAATPLLAYASVFVLNRGIPESWSGQEKVNFEYIQNWERSQGLPLSDLTYSLSTRKGKTLGRPVKLNGPPGESPAEESQRMCEWLADQLPPKEIDHTNDDPGPEELIVWTCPVCATICKTHRNSSCSCGYNRGDPLSDDDLKALAQEAAERVWAVPSHQMGPAMVLPSPQRHFEHQLNSHNWQDYSWECVYCQWHNPYSTSKCYGCEQNWTQNARAYSKIDHDFVAD
jgi:hypothetical protein